MTRTERRNEQVAEAIKNRPGRRTISDLAYGVLAVRDAADAWEAVIDLENAGRITRKRADGHGPWTFWPAS